MAGFAIESCRFLKNLPAVSSAVLLLKDYLLDFIDVLLDDLELMELVCQRG